MQKWSILTDCLMIKNAYKKQERSNLTFYCYFALMALTLLLLELSTFTVLRASGQHEWLLITSQALFGAACLFCILVWASDPGKLKKDKDLDFVQLLDTMEASSLCPDCQVVRTPRCRHCTLCNACVDRYDHHCPWVNNCIGRGNLARFYTFVLLQSLYLFSLLAVSLLCKFILIMIDQIWLPYDDIYA